MWNIFKKKAKETSIRVRNEFPKQGDMFVWSETFSETIGVVVSVYTDRIIFAKFQDYVDSNNSNLFEFILEDGKLYLINSIREKIEQPLDYVKNNIEFFNKSEAKKQLLQNLIDFKEKCVITRLEEQLKQHKDRLKIYIELRDKL